ncbi:Phosphorylcholine metabolism protein LicD [Oribacterium sp. KHPX15]|uniref:LicD family protein n=1 Tax=Oribacterium sp. KHPX15 TaxID=1855342 RepID=UPI0008995504|nr:LicD family protein [Oribacterium sp. KHPX15]SEA43387.1 Phosphorylcholine metabolism protein LicD [Oribacterium sp. KHPX15]
MTFPDDFFEDEVREGFFITSMMKRCWAAQLQILEDVDTLCAKYNIKYFGDCGTLLGAIRHGGYIPWDDDLDICMLREDYELFLKHAGELPGNYSILNWWEDEDWIDAFTRVVNTTCVRFDEDFLSYYHGFPYSVGIDIFVLDYMYEDTVKENERQARAKMYMNVANSITDDVSSCASVKSLIKSIETACNVKFDRSRSIRKQLYRLVDKAMTEVDRADASKVCLTAVWLEHHSCFWEKKYCDRVMRVPYECTTLQVPVCYDAILKAHYGDYMKVNRSGGLHEYPYYKKQEVVLTEEYGWKSWDYQWDIDELTLASRIREEKNLRKKLITEKIHKFEALISSAPDIYGDIRPEIDKLKLEIEKPNSRTEVVFLTLGPEYWKNFSHFWDMENSKPDTDVYVIPISYFDTALNGDATRSHYVTEGYEIPVTTYEEYNIGQRQPKRIYIQCPYDDMNPGMTVHPLFYSSELLKYTDELIYVPMYDMEDFEPTDQKSAFGLNFIAKMPVLLHADTIYVPTERLKEEYVRALVEFSNGDTDESFWNEKIHVEDYRHDASDKNDHSKTKKTILYYTDVAPIALNGTKSLDKIRSSLSLLKESSGRLNVIWCVSENMKSVLNSKDCPDGKKLYEDYLCICREFNDEGWGTFTEHISADQLEDIDAYAGNPSPYAHILSYHKKPVMILKEYD